jgi:hypothetical protein
MVEIPHASCSSDDFEDVKSTILDHIVKGYHNIYEGGSFLQKQTVGAVILFTRAG